VNRKADFFTKRIDSHNESIQIANWNALVGGAAQVLDDVGPCEVDFDQLNNSIFLLCIATMLV